MVTWKELQEACLRKMFSLDGVTLVRDSNTSPYINSMPAAANGALRLLATAGRPFKKWVTIEQGGKTPTDATWSMGGWKGYDMEQLTDDFYCISEVLLADEANYTRFFDYGMEGNRFLILPAGQNGTFRIWYEAYPPRLTVDTAEDLQIDLWPEAVEMVVLYMAGQLYKDDDISIAQIYMNEFMTWLAELKESGKRAKGQNDGGGWTSVKGWT